MNAQPFHLFVSPHTPSRKTALHACLLTLATFQEIFEMIALFLMVLAPAPAHADHWQWQNPLPQGNTLWGVWGSSGNDVFAVGQEGAILHYEIETSVVQWALY
ncbi:MAG: hypothetical protein GC154_01710 [bacterium]|nr:hypothetical protein [bacterium]